MDIEAVVEDIADVLKRIDSSRLPFKKFQPGVGPYGEPQLVKLVAAGLNNIEQYAGCVKKLCVPPIY
jgi:hypothetical protein